MFVAFNITGSVVTNFMFYAFTMMSTVEFSSAFVWTASPSFAWTSNFSLAFLLDRRDA